jgi:hypothetical protein
MVEGYQWMRCVPPAVQDGWLYVACDISRPVHRQDSQQPDPIPAFFWSTDLMVTRIDTDTGKEDWTWRRPATTETRDACGTQADEAACHDVDEGITTGMSVVEGRVVLLHGPRVAAGVPFYEVNRGTCEPIGYPSAEYWGIDATTGDEWAFDEATDSEDPQGWTYVTAWPSGARGDLFLLMDSHFAIVDPQTGDVLHPIPIGQDDSLSIATGSGFAVLSGNEVIASTGQSLYRIDLEQGKLDPERAVFRFSRDSGTFFATWPLHHGGGMLYGVAVKSPTCGREGDVRAVLVAIDVERGRRAWVQELPYFSTPYHLGSFAAFDGANAAWINANGTLRVLGHTPASIQPVLNWSTLSPQPNETVRLDLSGSSPGVRGPPDRYKVDWGDGTETGWQTDANFTHTYSDVGTYTATISMKNDAGQQSSQAVRVFVAPPAAGPSEDAGAPASVVVMGDGIPWWWILIAAIGASIVTVGLYSGVQVARRPDYEERYRSAVRRALDAGEDPTTVLRPLREAWAISDLQHARILAEEREAAGEGPASARLVVGAVFLDRYRVLSRLGAGSQGRAYLCQDETTGRRVVIKAARAPKEAQTFILREAKAFAKIRSPHLVRMIDIDAVGRDVFLVLEYAGGGDLHRAIAEGPLEGDEAGRLAATVYGALKDLHKARLVHGDLSPHNVFGSPGDGFVVGDLGLSRTQGQATALATGAGTAGYVAPEVAAGGAHSIASDLYAAGRLMVAALTGDPESVDELDSPLRAWAQRTTHPNPRRRHEDAEAAWKAFRKASAAEQQE